MPTNRESQDVAMIRTAVVGAGIVGICCAIALADRGQHVTLIDRAAPGSETSRWNAGVLANSSVIPLNTPAIFPKLPRLMMGLHPGFRLNATAALPLLPWAMRFLGSARKHQSERTITALSGLIGISRLAHEKLLERYGTTCLKTGGWIIGYRGLDGFTRTQAHAEMLNARGVRTTPLTAQEIIDLEPHLKPVFTGAAHVIDTAFTDPVEMIACYLALAVKAGVVVRKAQVSAVMQDKGGLCLQGTDISPDAFDNVVLAAGAWTNDILRSCAKPLPMAVERGYLQTFEVDNKPARPFFDVDGGYVASPRPGGVQISSGTELTRLQARPDPRQLNKAVEQAKDALTLGAPRRAHCATGNRPSLPDGLPAIGPVASVKGLWIAAGHQHVGLSTSAGTATLLANMMEGAPTAIDCTPFTPSRFGV